MPKVTEAFSSRARRPSCRVHSTPASTAAVHALAEGVAESLRRTGCCIVRDPRVQEADNDRFLDMMECYFSQPWETKLKDTRPQLHYQVPPPEKFTILSSNASEG